MELKPHQQKVVNYMKTSDVRGILLYHKVGTGKTITSIAIAELYNKKKNSYCSGIYENTMGN